MDSKTPPCVQVLDNNSVLPAQKHATVALLGHCHPQPYLKNSQGGTLQQRSTAVITRPGHLQPYFFWQVENTRTMPNSLLGSTEIFKQNPCVCEHVQRLVCESLSPSLKPVQRKKPHPSRMQAQRLSRGTSQATTSPVDPLGWPRFVKKTHSHVVRRSIWTGS